MHCGFFFYFNIPIVKQVDKVIQKLLTLHLDKLAHHPMQAGGKMHEEFMKVKPDGQGGKNGVVDQCTPQVSQGAWGMLAVVFKQVSGDQVVKHCITQKLKSLVAIGQPIGQVKY